MSCVVNRASNIGLKALDRNKRGHTRHRRPRNALHSRLTLGGVTKPFGIVCALGGVGMIAVSRSRQAAVRLECGQSRAVNLE